MLILLHQSKPQKVDNKLQLNCIVQYRYYLIRSFDYPYCLLAFLNEFHFLHHHLVLCPWRRSVSHVPLSIAGTIFIKWMCRTHWKIEVPSQVSFGTAFPTMCEAGSCSLRLTSPSCRRGSWWCALQTAKAISCQRLRSIVC